MTLTLTLSLTLALTTDPDPDPDPSPGPEQVSQPRVVILTRTAYYRVTYNPKNGKIDHYHKTTLDKVRVLEKTVTGLKVYLTEQDGKTSVSKMAGWLATKVGAKEAKSDEFEHVREYPPYPYP